MTTAPAPAPAPNDQRRDLVSRQLLIRADTVNPEARTVEAVLASEAEVVVWDWMLWEPVREVLVMDGLVEMPAQVPLLDSHQRHSVTVQLGSTRGLRIIEEDGLRKLIGTRHLSSVEEAVSAFTKIREGHLTDGSIGYRVLQHHDLEPGQTVELGGRTWTNDGPMMMRISHEWMLMEDSLTPIGADTLAKMRSHARNTIQPPKESAMDDENTRGAGLADVLETAIEELVDDDTPRSTVIDDLAAAADIDADTVEEILAGDINCPPLERLESFADTLGISVDTLLDAAEGDGCTYGSTDEASDDDDAMDEDESED